MIWLQLCVDALKWNCYTSPVVRHKLHLPLWIVWNSCPTSWRTQIMNTVSKKLKWWILKAKKSCCPRLLHTHADDDNSDKIMSDLIHIQGHISYISCHWIVKVAEVVSTKLFSARGVFRVANFALNLLRSQFKVQSSHGGHPQPTQRRPWAHCKATNDEWTDEWTLEIRRKWWWEGEKEKEGGCVVSGEQVRQAMLAA